MKMCYLTSNKQPTVSLLASILLSIFWIGNGNLYTAVQWNPMNPLFKSSNDSKSVLQINVTMKSQMNIICPNVATNLIYLQNSIGKEHLFENLWFVDKQSFESCSIENSNKNLQLFKCMDPVNLKYKVVTFTTISPTKGEPEFEEGKEYYFIATSNGTFDSLDNRHHGHCKTHNMRLKVYVCVGENDPYCNTQAKVPEVVEPAREPEQSTASSPTNKINKNQKELQEGETGKSSKECFMTPKDKIWLIAIGIIVGIVLMLLLACLVFTCYKRKKTLAKDRDGKIPLNDRSV